MSDALAGQIISAIVTLGVAFFGYLKLKAGQKDLKTSQEKVESKVDTYSKAVDGMKTELVEAVKGRGEAEGALKAHAADKAEKIILSTEVTEKDAEKIATTVVDTVKKDPDIEVKKITK